MVTCEQIEPQLVKVKCAITDVSEEEEEKNKTSQCSNFR